MANRLTMGCFPHIGSAPILHTTLFSYDSDYGCREAGAFACNCNSRVLRHTPVAPLHAPALESAMPASFGMVPPRGLDESNE